jgi:hypothetical protein
VLVDAPVARPAPAAPEQALASEAVVETVLTEGGVAALESVSRAGAIARAAVGFAIETAIFVLLSLGLAYLEERENRKLIRSRMQEAQPRIQAALEDSADRIDALQKVPARPTVWANITVRVDSLESTISGGGFATEHVSLLDAGLAGVEVTTSYKSATREEKGEPRYEVEQYGQATTRTIHTFITYSVPLAYDPFSLDRAGLAKRIEQNEQDAGRDVPPAVVQALYTEHSALLRAYRGLEQ